MEGILGVFTVIVALFLIVSIVILWISTYPPKMLVKRFYENPYYDFNQYLFYYSKATAYRMLFSTFQIFGAILQILALAATFITVYVAADEKEMKYVVLASLIAATCEVARIMLQPEKYIKAFSDAALVMEFALLEKSEETDNSNNSGPDDPDKNPGEQLLKAYKKAEEIISHTKS